MPECHCSFDLLPKRNSVAVDANEFPSDEKNQQWEENEGGESVRNGRWRTLLRLAEHVNDFRFGLVLK